ncbi:MAG: Short chain dehydrogenase family protein, partial [Actinomycetia bacterium]|nr:Short chain dehydrogenase family protein [Actinomycetes bacterium]
SRRAWERVEKLQLSVDLDADVVARSVVRAVQRDRPSVQLPRRARAYPWLAHAPWRITDMLLIGVDRDTDEQGDEP